MGLKAQRLQNLAEGVNSAIPTSSWVRPACDAEDAKELATDIKIFITSPS